jgi:hypothetical protein
MSGVFLNASSIAETEADTVRKLKIQRNNIEFVFPDGFTELRLIEECRALNALDVTDPDNFDLMYDITMQMLVGKSVIIYFIDNQNNRNQIGQFLITNRYMNLRSADIIDEYPILVNWLVEFIAGYLGKKYPRSLNDIQAKMSERREHTKSLMKDKKTAVKTTKTK